MKLSPELKIRITSAIANALLHPGINVGQAVIPYLIDGIIEDIEKEE